MNTLPYINDNVNLYVNVVIHYGSVVLKLIYNYASVYSIFKIYYHNLFMTMQVSLFTMEVSF